MASKLTQIVLLMTLALVIVLPTILALIYKSEAKQAKFDLQSRRYKQDLVQIDLSQRLQEENNFKLVIGTGNVISTEPLTDPFFNLKVRNTLRLRRTVEVYDRRPKKRKGKDPICPCSGTAPKGSDMIDTNSHLTWVPVRNQQDMKSDTFFASETFVVGKHTKSEHDVHKGSLRLSKRQIESIGKYEKVNLTDD